MRAIRLIILSCLIFSLLHCGIFEKKYPLKGRFCNVLEKPPECIFVDFQNRLIQLDEDKFYPLESKNRVNYNFHNSMGENIKVELLTEHRVRLSNGKFFIRMKNK